MPKISAPLSDDRLAELVAQSAHEEREREMFYENITPFMTIEQLLEDYDAAEYELGRLRELIEEAGNRDRHIFERHQALQVLLFKQSYPAIDRWYRAVMNHFDERTANFTVIVPDDVVSEASQSLVNLYSLVGRLSRMSGLPHSVTFHWSASDSSRPNVFMEASVK